MLCQCDDVLTCFRGRVSNAVERARVDLGEPVWSYYDGPGEKSRCLDGRGGNGNRGMFGKRNGQNYTANSHGVQERALE